MKHLLRAAAAQANALPRLIRRSGGSPAGEGASRSLDQAASAHLIQNSQIGNRVTAGAVLAGVVETILMAVEHVIEP